MTQYEKMRDITFGIVLFFFLVLGGIFLFQLGSQKSDPWTPEIYEEGSTKYEQCRLFHKEEQQENELQYLQYLQNKSDRPFQVSEVAQKKQCSTIFSGPQTYQMRDIIDQQLKKYEKEHDKKVELLRAYTADDRVFAEIGRPKEYFILVHDTKNTILDFVQITYDPLKKEYTSVSYIPKAKRDDVHYVEEVMKRIEKQFPKVSQ